MLLWSRKTWHAANKPSFTNTGYVKNRLGRLPQMEFSYCRFNHFISLWDWAVKAFFNAPFIIVKCTNRFRVTLKQKLQFLHINLCFYNIVHFSVMKGFGIISLIIISLEKDFNRIFREIWFTELILSLQTISYRSNLI